MALFPQRGGPPSTTTSTFLFSRPVFLSFGVIRRHVFIFFPTGYYSPRKPARSEPFFIGCLPPFAKPGESASPQPERSLNPLHLHSFHAHPRIRPFAVPLFFLPMIPFSDSRIKVHVHLNHADPYPLILRLLVSLDYLFFHAGAGRRISFLPSLTLAVTRSDFFRVHLLWSGS